MKVAFIHHNLLPYHVARYNALVGTPYIPIDILAGPTRDRMDWNESLLRPNFKVIRLPETWSLFGKVIHLWRALDRISPQIVVDVPGLTSIPAMAAVVWARRNSRLTMLFTTTQQYDRKRVFVKEFVKRRLLNLFDWILVTGSRSKDYFVRLGFPPTKIGLVGNVMDNEHFAQSASRIQGNVAAIRQRLDLPEKFFLYVGRFAPEKNLQRLLTAYASYRDKIGTDAWGLVLVGSGPLGRDLRQMAKRAGLKRVIFAGFKQVDELPLHYALSSAIILPSVSEPWGLVVNEAMACGLPVLVSDRCGCVPELVHEGTNGYIFPPYDIQAIVDAMVRLSKLSQEERDLMGQNSRDIVSNFTPETWARKFSSCASEALASVG